MTKQPMIIDMDIEAINLNYAKGISFPHDVTFAISVRDTGKTILNQMYGRVLREHTNLCKEISLAPASMYYSNKMNKPKYKFSRAKWYEVEATFDTGRWSERIDWCTEHFGPDPQNPDAWSRWYPYAWNKIRFRDEKDYVWYCLRWA